MRQGSDPLKPDKGRPAGGSTGAHAHFQVEEVTDYGNQKTKKSKQEDRKNSNSDDMSKAKKVHKGKHDKTGKTKNRSLEDGQTLTKDKKTDSRPTDKKEKKKSAELANPVTFATKMDNPADAQSNRALSEDHQTMERLNVKSNVESDFAGDSARNRVKLENATMPLGAVLHILRERRRDQLYLNCLCYFIFILLYTVVVNLHHHIFTSFSQNYGLRDVLLNEPFQEPHDLRTYHDVGEIDEWWLWFEGPFAQKIWSETWYSGDLRDNATEIGLMLQECYVIGAIRLRQVRTVMETKKAGKRTFESWPPYRTVNIFTSKITSDYQNECASSSSKENPLFTGGGRNGDSSRGAETSQRLMTRDGTSSYGEYCTGLGALDGMSYDPLQTEHYGGAGYVIDLPRNNVSHAITTIKKLKAARWIDQGTRAVAVDVNVYNPATDTLTALRVSTEFLAEGLVLKVGWAFSSRLSMYDSSNWVDVVRICLECIIILGVLCYFIMEIQEMHDVGLGVYFSQLFNVLGFFNLIFISMAMIIHAWFMFSFVSRLDLAKETHSELYPALEWWAVKKNLAGGTLMLGYLRIFRYLELNARVKVLIYALMNSLEDLATSLMVLVILILAFSLCGMLLFGENVSDFSGFGFSVSTLMRALINDFDYEQLRYFHPSMAPLFYSLYVLLILVVVFNMVIAVIIDGFEEAKNIILHQKYDKELNRAPFVMSRTKFWRKKMWLLINECSIKRRVRLCCKKDGKASLQGKTPSNAGNEVLAVKVRPVCLGSEAKGNLDEDTSGPPLRKGSKMRRASTKKDIVVSNLASSPHLTETHFDQFLKNMSTARETLKPAHALKSLFKGQVEKNFRKMYAMNALATHALGDDSLINLSRNDLELILGNQDTANEVMDLYQRLHQSRKAHEKDFLDGAGSNSPAKSNNVGSMEEMLNRATTAAMNSRLQGGGSGLEMMPMIAEMAKAINALSEQVNIIARQVSEKPKTVANPVKIQIRQIQEKMTQLQKGKEEKAVTDYQMLMQMNALMNPDGIRRMRSGPMRSSNDYMRNDRLKHKDQLMGVHSIPDAL